MLRTAKLSGAVALACMLSACGDSIPSEFHGKWRCRTGIFEISGGTVAYSTPHHGKELSPGNFRAAVEDVKEMGGTKYVRLKKAPMGAILLKRDGSMLEIDTAPCMRM